MPKNQKTPKKGKPQPGALKSPNRKSPPRYMVNGKPITYAEARSLASRLKKYLHANRAKPKNMHKRNRQKGLDFERNVAEHFRMIGFLNAKRHLEFQRFEAAHGVDIHLVGPFRPQCKNMQGYANPNVIEEVQDKSGIPILFTKAHGKEPLVVIPFELFFQMAEMYMRSKSVRSGLITRYPQDWSDPQHFKFE